MNIRSVRLRAPALTGRGGWINTNGEPLSLEQLRGKVVVLDFWTSCCVNCLHVIAELHALEDRYPADQLAIVGVHSPKFAHEGAHEAVVAAVGRHGITHPVLDDPDLETWSAYGIRAWPTLVVIDQEGYAAHIAAGEGQLPILTRVIDAMLSPGRAPGEGAHGESGGPSPAGGRAIRYPAKIVRMRDGGLLLANTGAHNLLLLGADGGAVTGVIGAGVRGCLDGKSAQARFCEPTGACVLEERIASEAGFDVAIADRGNHAIRGLRLSDGSVVTLASGLSSPWDVEYWPAVGKLVIAMAGSHRLVALDPLTRSVSPLAGSGYEGIKDGPAAGAHFAQPSGVAAEPGPSGALWVADAETSALRRVWLSGSDVMVATAIGRGLFDFGFRDGPARQALLQHPQGVALLPGGEVVIADTFNGAVRMYAPVTGEVSTIVRGLREPTGVLASGAAMAVVESAAHRVTWAPSQAGPAAEPAVAQGTPPAQRRRIAVATSFEMSVVARLPGSMHVDDAVDAPIRLAISSSPPSLLRAGGGNGRELRRRLEIDPAVEQGVIHVSASVACCDDSAGICTVMTQDWNCHVEHRTGGSELIELVLSGTPEQSAWTAG